MALTGTHKVAAFTLLWLALLPLSVALSVLAAQQTPLPGDARILSWTQDQTVPGSTVSEIARTLETTQLVLVIGWLSTVILWLTNHRKEAVIMAIAMIVLPLMQTGIKELVDRPRPSPPLVELRAGYTSPSFPSGHVMSATVFYALALFLAYRLPFSQLLRAGMIAVSLFAVVMAGPANVWTGVHWPSDILGGYAWGLIILLPLIYALASNFPRRRKLAC
jgi:undecaprenyl-diphosphatase